MIIKSQPILYCKKHISHFIVFLFVLVLSWYAWTSLIPRQPRSVITPLKDSEFVAFTPDSRKLITREPQWYMPPGAWRIWAEKRRTSCIQIWDAENGSLLRTLGGDWAETEGVIPSQDSRQLIGWTIGEPGKSPNSIKSCDLLSGETIQEASRPCKHGNLVKMAFSPDGKWLGISPVSGFVEHFHTWGVGSDHLVDFDNIGPKITFSEDGQYLAGSTELSNFSVEIWRLRDLSRPWRKHKWDADQGFVFPDCKTAATYNYNNSKLFETKLWDVSTGRLLANFPAVDSGTQIQFLHFPPDGTILTHHVGGAATAIWDISRQPRLIAILKDWKITASEDKNWILQSEEKGVHLVGLRSGKQFSLTRSVDAPTSNQGAPGQFSPDSRMVAVTGIYPRTMDNRFFRWIRDYLPIKIGGQWQPVARLWDVETGTELGAYACADEPHPSPTVLFSPDSKTLATLQEDRTIRLWDVPPRSRIWQIFSWASILWLVYVSANVWKKSRRGEPKKILSV